MGLDFDVLEFCRKLRTSNKPPYTCPVVECGKSYKSMCGLQYHLVNFDHDTNSAAIVPPSPPESVESLVSTPATPCTPPPAKKRKKSHHGRWSHTPKLKTPLKVVEPILTPPREGLTYAEAQKLVEFEVNGRVHRINISDTISIISKKELENHCDSMAITEISQSVLSLAKSQEAVTKLPEPCFKVLDNYKIADAAQMPNSYVRFIERSAEEMDGEVEYDMDEEDAAWLTIINQKRAVQGVPEVSIDTFELLMDRLEKESYFQMQNKGTGESAPAVIDDDAVCCICLDGECQNSNVILFCDMCNLAVHQDCYGVPYIPEGQWLCRRCLQSPSRAVDCVLCPNNGGAFKQTDRGHWAHVVCALWIPEVRFANTVFLEPIDSIETIPPARWKLTCYICKQRGVGACIQCHKTNCYSAFHVTCAQQAGLFMKMDTVRHINTVGSEPGPVMVQKTAYCETHTPPDCEPRPRPAITGAEEHRRLQLAKKRSSVPVISIPTIPPDRIQEIGSLVTLAKKSQFLQRLIAYWTLKRQFRNGVPLLRRLQSSHLARSQQPASTRTATSDISELYRQLKYWQCLRQDLERARLLCELVRKREKYKNELVKVKSQCVEMKLCPLECFLRKLLDLLRARDTGEIFIEPVDQTEVPDYGEVVKHPMDLSTMRVKVDNFEYSSLEEFEADFHLMIDNCLAYNSKDTVFYRAALKMRDQGGVLLRQAARDLEAMGLDRGSGLSLENHSPIKVPSTPVEETIPAEIDKQLAAVADPNNTMGEDEIMCKLLQLLDSCQNLKHGTARARRIKMVNAEIAKLKKKSSSETNYNKLSGKREAPDSGESSDEEPTNKSSPNVDQKQSNDNLVMPAKRPRRKKTWDDFVEEPITGKHDRSQSMISTVQEGIKGPGTPSKQGIGENHNTTSPSGVNRRTAVLFTRKAAAATSKLQKTDDLANPAGQSTPPVRRRGRQPKKHLQNSGLLDSSTETVTMSSSVQPTKDSFSVYRSGGDIRGETDEESHSDGESSCSVCSSSDESSGSGSDSGSSYESDSDESVVSASVPAESEALEQLQLVWAKCRGYPWYPALIINPKMPRGYVHNGVPIPSPPADVLALANNYTEPVYLVLFFDTKRTWQWLPRNKLEPLGVTPELDQIKLVESRKPADRKAVRKAYQEALTHRTQVDKKEEESKTEDGKCSAN
ncbi:peregrin isoform X2 [Macrosteles quadrilineatus]|uniref:peregrin isoform X2 n=1 Tax=Macrosteles quadrilineatus TaxID=74068 RepID=UPI0023E17EE4|nr:peregrin isoform X2 [Macrosteles quadrilineatus]